ncbi:MAG: RNA polymerase sigma factor [Bacteroidota bacterium]
MSAQNQFDSIYDTNYPNVFRICLGYFGGNESIAKEVAQDVFVKVWGNLSNFRNESSISTWIYRITVNTCLSNIKIRKKQHVSVEKHLGHLKSEFENQTHETEAQIKALYRCIDKLNRDNKSLILLELQGLPQKEIAYIMGMAHGTVRTRLHRIKNELTKCVKT